MRGMSSGQAEAPGRLGRSPGRLKRTPANRPELTEEQRTALIAEVIDDIERLEDLLDQSFTDWKGHRVGGTYSVRKS